jgi:hypothetical protein
VAKANSLNYISRFQKTCNHKKPPQINIKGHKTKKEVISDLFFSLAPPIDRSCSRLPELSIQINEKLISTHLMPFLISRIKTESIILNLQFIFLILFYRVVQDFFFLCIFRLKKSHE